MSRTIPSHFDFAHVGFARRCFLALKHGSEAMTKTNPSRGKNLSGGSIIMTASGRFSKLAKVQPLHLHTRGQSPGYVQAQGQSIVSHQKDIMLTAY